ncbi:MAG: acetoacetate decarboxylase family protein [Pseudomonadota bacterium]|nr:acetoacetate decarboxylase family protein [Pseudomonadota bacterium]
MQIDPFFQVPRRTLDTSSGPLEVPVLYKEGDYSIALFCAHRQRVEALLNASATQSSLTPAMTFGPYAIVSLVMANFTHCSDADYSVAGLAVPVSRRRGFQPVSPWRELFRRADQRHMGFYLVNCPADSLRMINVGREIWGHPKTPARIDLQLDQNSLRCRVDCLQYNQPLFEFSGWGPRFWQIRPLGMNLFSILNQQMIRSILDVRSPFNLHLPFGFRLQLAPGDHPTTRPMRKLGLDGKRPLMVISTNQFQGRFNEGVVIEELGQAAQASPRTVRDTLRA